MIVNRIFLAVALLSASTAFPQMPGPGGPGRGPGGMHGGGGFGMARSHKMVTGAPYSADVNNTTIRTLTDANTIQHVTTGHVARDGQGRTFSTETVTGGMMGQSGTKTFTFISDPVAGYAYVLNSETKTAIRRTMHTPGTSAPAFSQHMDKTRPADPSVVQTDLGTQLLNGVNAQGKKTTRTVAAGQMGNAMPIVSTSESWYSPDLQIVVSSTREDPREGKSTFTLTNIQRAEPSSTLFQVPSDYTVKDAPKPGGGHMSPQ